MGRVRVLRLERLPPPPALGSSRLCRGSGLVQEPCFYSWVAFPSRAGRTMPSARYPRMLRWSRCVQGREEGRSWGRPPRSPLGPWTGSLAATSPSGLDTPQTTTCALLVI